MNYKPSANSTIGKKQITHFEKKRHTQKNYAVGSKTFSGENSPERDNEVGFEFQKVTNTRGRFS